MKQMLFRLLYVLPLLLISVLSLKLYFESALTLYIHPRYVIFVFIFSCVGLILSLTFIFMAVRQTKKVKIIRPFPFAVSLIASVALAAAIMLPPKTLSTELAEKRVIGGAQEKIASEENCRFYQAYKYRSEFLRWHTLLEYCADLQQYRGEPLDIKGFVYNVPDTGDKNTMVLGRFVMRCCAVDAQPISLLVEEKNWQKKYSTKQWLRVKGKLEPRQINGEVELVIVPERLEPIPVPEEPYAFY